MFRGATTIAACLIALVGCIVQTDKTSSTAGETFADFKAHTFRETFPGGLYIVDGDTPVENDKQLYEFWAARQQGGLIVNTVGGNDDRWNDQAKLELTYCVSNDFGSNKAAIVDALQAATAHGWEQIANVHFSYVSGQDGVACAATNNNVVFDVRLVAGQAYLARAFYPSSPRAARELLIDTNSFDPAQPWPLAHIVAHELGHALGFRHEHTRPEAGTCFEDNNWRELTPYDSSSIMHYPQCNGSAHDLNWSQRDAQGAAALYGASGAGGVTPPPSGTAHSEMRSGAIHAHDEMPYGPYSVAVGSTLTVMMSGSGDPDLYVRWNGMPTTIRYNCRPYLDGANEQCSLTVPAGMTEADVLVRGYEAATYALSISWMSP